MTRHWRLSRAASHIDAGVHDYLSTLRTTQAPYEKLLRLGDLFEYLAEPDAEHAWVLLDIKVDGTLELGKRSRLIYV